MTHLATLTASFKTNVPKRYHHLRRGTNFVGFYFCVCNFGCTLAPTLLHCEAIPRRASATLTTSEGGGHISRVFSSRPARSEWCGEPIDAGGGKSFKVVRPGELNRFYTYRALTLLTVLGARHSSYICAGLYVRPTVPNWHRIRTAASGTTWYRAAPLPCVKEIGHGSYSEVDPASPIRECEVI